MKKLICLALFILSACGGSMEDAPAPPGPTCTRPSPIPLDKCVKESNKELCWDDVDNNCDGCIDEGCPAR